MQGKAWEMKSPKGSGKTTISHTIKHAVTQSENIIIDLQRCKLDEGQAIRELEHPCLFTGIHSFFLCLCFD
jgi:ABC-type molybdenum transport system ATPase subunit/photorepair protein PhrA